MFYYYHHYYSYYSYYYYYYHLLYLSFALSSNIEVMNYGYLLACVLFPTFQSQLDVCEHRSRARQLWGDPQLIEVCQQGKLGVMKSARFTVDRQSGYIVVVFSLGFIGLVNLPQFAGFFYPLKRVFFSSSQVNDCVIGTASANRK